MRGQKKRLTLSLSKGEAYNEGPDGLLQRKGNTDTLAPRKGVP